MLASVVSYDSMRRFVCRMLMIDLIPLTPEVPLDSLIAKALTLPQVMVLDGGAGTHPDAQHSLISAWPEAIHKVAVSQQACCSTQIKQQIFTYQCSDTLQIAAFDSAQSAVDLFKDTIKSEYLNLQTAFNTEEHSQEVKQLPFIGGYLGYLSYEFGLALRGVASRHATTVDQSLAEVGRYAWAIIEQHQTRKRVLMINHQLISSKTLSKVMEWVKHFKTEKNPALSNSANTVNLPPLKILSLFKPDTHFDHYQQAFQQVKSYIHSGDCYQTNLTQRFSAECTGSLATAFSDLKLAAKSPFMGFYQGTQIELLSVSPERFIQCRNGDVQAKPIKGTIKRGSTPEEDRANALILKNSSKDCAENLMIVDLLRNDIAQNCVAGSVKVPKLFALESFPNVHHLVSTIKGKLDAQKTPIDLLFDAFPGGSITGAPKKRAMEIIDEVEANARSLYCGSLFYLSCDGQLDSNILIRSFTKQSNQIHCWGGGGIVFDSHLEAEYQESLTKVSCWITLLEQRFSA
jgi:para-aminobenzoate synthetase component 1